MKDLHITIDTKTVGILSDIAKKRALSLEECAYEFLMEALEQEQEDAADLACINVRDVPGAVRVSSDYISD